MPFTVSSRRRRLPSPARLVLLGALLLAHCGSEERKFQGSASGGSAGQSGSTAHGGKTPAASGGVGDGGLAGAPSFGGTDGGVPASTAGETGSGGAVVSTGGAETSGEGGAAGNSDGSCTTGERSCINEGTARACVGGRWIQERCDVTEPSHVSTCTAGLCKEVCPAGLLECSGACVNTQSAPENCGSCGHDCGGGTCTKGACAPQTIAPAQDGAFALALTPDALGVFWLRATGVWRCPVTGCAANKPFMVADVQNKLLRPYIIEATATNVFWLANASTLNDCPAAGCTFQTPNTSADIRGYQARELTQRGAYRYIVDKFSILECQTASCTPLLSTCIGGDSIQSFAWNGTRAVWADTTDPSGLYRCDSTGGMSTRLTSIAGQVVRLFGDTAYVMSANAQKVYSCPAAGCGGLETDLATNLAGLTSMAVDASGVYFTLSGSDSAPTGSVLTCPLTGCTGAPKVVASGQARPTSVHVANGFAYWVNSGVDGVTDSGAVMRVRL